MPKIQVENLSNATIEADESSKSLLQALHAARIDWMHACGGKGRCTTCKAIIIAGDVVLSPLTPAERRFEAIGALKRNERLACQCTASGDIVIRVPEEYKLPHIRYTD